MTNPKTSHRVHPIQLASKIPPEKLRDTIVAVAKDLGSDGSKLNDGCQLLHILIRAYLYEQGIQKGEMGEVGKMVERTITAGKIDRAAVVANAATVRGVKGIVGALVEQDGDALDEFTDAVLTYLRAERKSRHKLILLLVLLFDHVTPDARMVLLRRANEAAFESNILPISGYIKDVVAFYDKIDEPDGKDKHLLISSGDEFATLFASKTRALMGALRVVDEADLNRIRMGQFTLNKDKRNQMQLLRGTDDIDLDKRQLLTREMFPRERDLPPVQEGSSQDLTIKVLPEGVGFDLVDDLVSRDVQVQLICKLVGDKLRQNFFFLDSANPPKYLELIARMDRAGIERASFIISYKARQGRGTYKFTMIEKVQTIADMWQIPLEEVMRVASVRQELETRENGKFVKMYLTRFGRNVEKDIDRFVKEFGDWLKKLPGSESQVQLFKFDEELGY